MKLMKVLFVAAIAIAIAAPSFAAVQNIKVSGSIEERAIWMNNFDLRNKGEEDTSARHLNAAWGANDIGSGASINEDQDGFILSTVKVGVSSDLTDNVSANIVLANQTRWGDAANATDVDINKAYITLKEFFYQPLTLKIGRQDLMFGQGFVVGPGIFRDPSGAFPRPRTDVRSDPFTLATANVATNISGPMGEQYSISTYYDAIRATIDLDPWTVDGIYGKITETDTANDDWDFAGVNAAYKFDSYNSKVEGYYFYSGDQNFNSDLGYIHPVDLAEVAAGNLGVPADVAVPGAGARVYEENLLHVVGLRGDIDPVENLTLSGEGAYQFGRLIDDAGPFGPLERDRSAWAAQVAGNYLWKDSTYKPSMGAGFVFRSGEEPGNSGDFNGWDPVFHGQFYSYIRDYQAGTGAAWNSVGGNIYQTLDYLAPSGSTNSYLVYVDGGLTPMEDLAIKARYLHWWAVERANVLNLTSFSENPRSGRSIGDEVDASLVYDYTEDVQFDLTGGVFVPGKLFDNNTDVDTKGNDTAVIVTGSVKVAF